MEEVITVVGGKQAGQQDYFEALFYELKEAGLLPDQKSDAKWRRGFQKYYDELAFEPHILTQISNEYGNRFTNVILVNSKKNALLCEQFGVRKNKRLLKTAVYFTLLGCILDALLDHGSPAQKAEAVRKLHWECCGDYIGGYKTPEGVSAVDLLFGQLAEGMQVIKGINENRYAYIMQLIQKAATAELLVEEPGIQIIPQDTVIDKSVVFTEISAEITLAEYRDISNGGREIISSIGHMFALIDDVCDYYEDLESGQKNIIARQISQGNERLVIKQAVCEINRYMEYLKAKSGSRLYRFIREEVKGWAFSNEKLRELIWTWECVKYGKDSSNWKTRL